MVLAPRNNNRIVAWAAQEQLSDDTDWIGSVTNTAGYFEVPGEGELLCGRRTRNGTLIWSATDLWLMTYIGGQFVYSFEPVGNKLRHISPQAAVVNDTTAFWMGLNGFFVFDGTVRPIPCDVQDYVFSSLNMTYAHYIWALENPLYGEVTWFYPHAAQTEITRYVTYSYRENHWVTGALARTCGVAFQPGYTTLGPVMCNASAAVFDHETGTGRNSEGTPSLESGPVEVGDGDRLVEIQRVLPDDKTVNDTLSANKTPAVSLTLYHAINPDTGETTSGPHTLTASTSIRVKARQIRLKLLETTAAAWRVGTIRLGVIASSRR